MQIDMIIFGKQPADASCGRMYDGEDPWVISKNVTPGYANEFPIGRGVMIWTLSYSTDSYNLIKNLGDCIQAISRLDPVSGKIESAYTFWGRTSGQNFSIAPGGNYSISITSPFTLTY